jgi:uncharacterized protein YciI
VLIITLEINESFGLACRKIMELPLKNSYLFETKNLFHMKYLIGLGLILLTFSGFSQERESTYREGDVEYHMKKYYFLILIRGDNQVELSEGRKKSLQDAHLDYIDKMAEQGVVKIAGPFEGDEDMRGILIFDVDTEEEVRVWMQGDPLVEMGRLRYKILPWWTEKGGCLD